MHWDFFIFKKIIPIFNLMYTSSKYVIFILLLSFKLSIAQEITSFQQFNGRYDYTAIGNTLNPAENNLDRSFCDVLEESSARLSLDSSNEIIAAYLFWAGSGLGDTTVTLNNTDFEADETYNVFFDESATVSLPYFSCVKDVTTFIQTNGNINYTLKNLDISDTLSNNTRYCSNRTNFAGWSIYIIYKNDTLPLNQVNLFVGLDIINRFVGDKTILIENLNVLDNNDAKIGFLAWEGDNALNFGESLSINGNVLSNPPLNNANNAFNGTNTFTNSSTYYNCDLDVYNIENNINIGDTEATITLTTGGFDIFGNFRADLIILNNIITVLNSQVPDATVILNDLNSICNSNELTIDYTISNINSTASLPSNMPVAIFVNNNLLYQTTTTQEIPIGDNITMQTIITLPAGISGLNDIFISVDNDGFNNSTIVEIVETNNNSEIEQVLIENTQTINLNLANNCINTDNTNTFNLNDIITPEYQNNYSSFTFFETLIDLENNNNPIPSPNNYTTNILPTIIYAKAEKNNCFDILSITLNTETCQINIPQGISPNNDGLNDILIITLPGNKTTTYTINIYNRYGTIVFKGSHNNQWDGTSNRGINRGSHLPTGTYYFILHSDNQLLNKKSGWIYLNK